MANQYNYPDPLTGTQLQRPSRVASNDIELMHVGTKQVLFGTTLKDVVEVWVYNPDGTFAGHMNIRPTDPNLSLTTLVDQTGVHELLNMNVTEVANALNLDPGRYTVTMNILRDEVGSEEGYRLYISQISEDRTEVRLFPVKVSPESVHDIFEFTEPSVPPLYAQALIQKTLNYTNVIDPTSVTEGSLNYAVNEFLADTTDRLAYSGVYDSYVDMVRQIMVETSSKALDAMAADNLNFYVNQAEIESYIIAALETAITDVVSKGVDSRIQII